MRFVFVTYYTFVIPASLASFFAYQPFFIASFFSFPVLDYSRQLSNRRGPHLNLALFCSFSERLLACLLSRFRGLDQRGLSQNLLSLGHGVTSSVERGEWRMANGHTPGFCCFYSSSSSLLFASLPELGEGSGVVWHGMAWSSAGLVCM